MKRLLSLSTALWLLAHCAAPIASAQRYVEIKLVSNRAGTAAKTDKFLINPWGLSRLTGSPWWVSDNGTGFASLYSGNGTIAPLDVSIPRSNPANGAFKAGTPTGTIANGSLTDFLLAPGMPAVFMFATIDGTISGWNPAVGVAAGASPPSKHSVIVVKTTDGSVFTGLTSATINGKRYLYAANFGKGTVDVFDNAFHHVTLPSIGDQMPFADQQLPANYVPFNVQAIGNDIVVTYALHEPGNPIETDGPGLGRVDIYSSSGQLLRSLAHGDWLNAPWGVALAPLDFGTFSHALLIGQFAGGGTTENSGTIAAYDLATGHFLGQLKTSTGGVLAVNGLWALSPGNSASASSYDSSGAPASEVYFTAGPNGGSGGLFGYLEPAAADLVVGNDQ